MKKEYIRCLIINLTPILILCILVFARTNTKNADAVISSDYSEITYKGETFVPVALGDLPIPVARTIDDYYGKESIKATVEGENYFLDKYFFTNWIIITEFEGEMFIYLNTDYDVNESDYYCPVSYKEKLENQ